MSLAEKLPDAASTVVRRVARREDVRGVLCFGSYALGTFDDDSDIDLYVFCDPKVMSEASRRRMFEGLPELSDLELNYVTPGFEVQWIYQTDRFRLGDVHFDVAYHTAAWIKAVVQKVTQEGRSSIQELRYRAHAMLGLLENSIVLHDTGSFLDELISGIRPYPPKLKERLMADSLALLNDRIGDLRDCAERGIGNACFLFHLTTMSDALCTLLFALNERYDPSTKRVEEALERLEVLPLNFRERYAALLTGPFDGDRRLRAVEEYNALIREIEELSRSHASAPRGETS